MCREWMEQYDRRTLAEGLVNDFCVAAAEGFHVSAVVSSHLVMNQENKTLFPQGLKPASLAAVNGSAKAEPLQNWFMRQLLKTGHGFARMERIKLGELKELLYEFVCDAFGHVPM